MKRRDSWFFQAAGFLLLIAHPCVANASPVVYASAAQQLDSELSEAIAEEAQAEAETVPDAKLERRVSRISRRLERRLPRSLARMQKRVDAMSEAEVENLYEKMTTEASASDHREWVKSTLSRQMREAVPESAREIAQAGGMIPYLLKTKAWLKDRNDPLSDPAKGLGKCFFGSLATILILGGLTILFSFGLLWFYVLPAAGAIGAFCGTLE